MPIKRVMSIACWNILVLTFSAHAAEFEWVPVSATGVHAINGNTIVLTGGGQQVTIDLRISGTQYSISRSSWQNEPRVFDA